MNKQEYIHFLELNYNINIIENNSYTKLNIDTSFSKEHTEQNNKLVASSWLNEKDDILNALHVVTDNLEIKKTIPYIGLNPPDEVYDLVSNNLKTFENLYANSLKLEALGAEDINSVLININKGKPVNVRNVNRHLKLLHSIDTINNPKTKTDEINRRKLVNFLDEAAKEKNKTKNVLLKLWKKQRCNSITTSYYNLIDLIEYYKET